MKPVGSLFEDIFLTWWLRIHIKYVTPLELSFYTTTSDSKSIFQLHFYTFRLRWNIIVESFSITDTLNIKFYTFSVLSYKYTL